MAPARLGLSRVVHAQLRYHWGGLAGVFIAALVASALVTGLGVLVESGVRGGLAPQRYAAVDVVVGARQQVSVPEDLPVPLRERALVSPDVAQEIMALPGVDAVIADVTVPLVISARGAAGQLVSAHPWSSAPLTGSALTEGRPPSATDDVVVATGSGHAVGDSLYLAFGGISTSYTVVGLVEAGQPATRTWSVFLTDQRIAVLDPHAGAPRALGVLAANPEQVAATIRDLYPDLVARTGDARGDVEFLESGAARAQLVAIGTAFVATFVLVALFIVAGTLTLSVQARRREYALLRAVGATPRQVHALIAREVLTVAAIAALLGIAPGFLLSWALQAAFAAGGVIPGDFALALSPIPALGALLLVLGAAWVAAGVAARRPARLDPIEALQESSTGPGPIGLTRRITGIAFAVGGVSLSTLPFVLGGDAAVGASAGTAMTLIVALALLGPWLVAACLRLLGPVLRRRSASHFLASAHIIEGSRRTAAAILPIALGIGLGLVQIGGPAIVAAEASNQARAGVTADLRVTAAAGLSPEAVESLRARAGVAAASEVVISTAVIDFRDMEGDLERTEYVVQGIDPATARGLLDLQVREGSLDTLTAGSHIAVSTDAAQALRLGVGDSVIGVLGDGAPLESTVVAVYQRGLGFGDFTMIADQVRRHTSTGLNTFALISVHGSITETAAALASEGLLVTPASGQEASGSDAASEQGWVNLVALLVILGYIAIAVVNTLVMATGERSREFALLRLIGATRGQVRAMMRTEAFLTAGISMLFGVLVAILPLMGMSYGVSGQPIPAMPVLGSLTIIGGMGALALVALQVATNSALRKRPIDEIGARQ